MKHQNNKLRKLTGNLALIILVALAVLKWFWGWCSIWLCLAFGVTVVAWSIISDSTESEKPSEESPNDTTPSGSHWDDTTS